MRIFPRSDKHSGFTIVELLIVIVVIAILAAISIVAYNGIQTRAENNKTAQGLAAYAKALALYAVDNGTYPSTTTYPCLGNPTSNQCGRVAGSTTTCPVFTGLAVVNSTFDADLAPYIGSTKPTLSNNTLECAGYQFRGAHVYANSTNPKILRIKSFFKGTGDCPTVGSLTLLSRQQHDQTIYCSFAMPTLA